MKLRRGCGCPLLILVLANGFFVVASIIRVIAGPSDEPVEVQASRLGSGLSLVLFAANLGVCVLLAIAALRGQSLNEGQSEGEEAPEEGSDTEGKQDSNEV